MKASRTGPDNPTSGDFAPRAVRREPLQVGLTPFELHPLIETLQARACRAADDPDLIDYADYLFRRIHELREATR
jgi:hypothetical protein